MPSPELGREVSLDRRQFLARCGVLGAGMLAGGPLAGIARAQDPAADLAKVAASIMRQLAYDTFGGLVAFTVPGQDQYSKAQGVTSPTPGGVEAKAHEAIMESADYFLPLPDTYAHAMAAAFTTGVSDQPLPAEFLQSLGAGFETGGATLDRALLALLGTDGAVPLSLLFALFMNFEASAVDPAAMLGPIPTSPFASLKFADKAKVFERIERTDTDLINTVDSHLPEPLRDEISGVFKFVGGTLLEFAGYTPWVEFGVFDREKGTVSSRPVGWEISRYLPGRTIPVEGTSDFIGYYKKHKKAAGRAPRYRAKKKTTRRPSNA